MLDGTAIRVGHYNPDQKLRLALAIQPPHMAEEENFIKELTTRGSPSFHKFLTQDQWNARFAPSAADEQAVMDWAASVGLTVTHRYPNRLLVDVEGTAGVIEKAFGITINNYQVGEEVDFANDRDPAIPARLSGILHAVLGLNSIERAHRLGTSKSTVKGPDYVAGPAISVAQTLHGDGDPAKAPATRASATMTGPHPADNYPLRQIGSTYAADPDNIQSSQGYDFNALQALSHCCNEPGNSGGSPPEASIALVGFGNFTASDVLTFLQYYGMAGHITSYYINGSGFPSVDGEAPLDVEYAAAMANSYGSYLDTAHVYEYEIPNNLYASYADAFNSILSDNYAKVVSTSYGWEENVGFSSTQAINTMHPIFNNMVGAGWTLIASSGDSGSSAGCGNATAALYPSTDPDFIAAGGTQLQLDDNGIYQSETAWQGETWSGACSSNHGGSTGGRSVLFSAPYWQTSIESPYYGWIGSQEYIVSGNTNRLVPDISLTANPDVMGQWYYSGGGWYDEGGTSIVAPELAGFFAQLNSYLDFVGSKCGSSGTSACSPVGLASPFIYWNALYGAPHDPFYDITSGCGNNDNTAYWGLFYFCAYPGYDLMTGWGSANMLQLAWGINWELLPAIGQPSIDFSGPATNTWYNSNQTLTWTVFDADNSGHSFPAPGVAGFTQGWDSIPSDPSSEAHGGDGNSFYSGPQYPFANAGCMAFSDNGCAGNSGAQGCHTAWVEAWDHQGRNATNSYGPLCYDSVAPTISASTNPTTSGSVWVNQSVVVTLTPSDSGGGNASGIYKTYYAINKTSCVPGNTSTCSVYTAPFTVSGQQQSYIYHFTEDNAGNFSTEPYIWVSIDLTAPSTSASLSGTIFSGSTYKTAVQVTLSASDTGGSGVLHTYYQIDSGLSATYSGAFTVSALGSHSIKYWSRDSAGNTETSKTASFAIVSPTTSSLVATPNPSLVGQSVTMKATVTATISGTPTGSVTFWNGSTNLGSVTLSGGVATLSTTGLPLGHLTLQASYTGAGNFLSSNSAPFNQTVDQKTTTAVTSSLNPAPYGQSVTFTATVTPSNSGTPTGTVSFYAGTTLLGHGTLNSSAVASIVTTSLAAGASAITAVYSGDSTYATSTSPVLTETVDLAAVLTSPIPGSTLTGTSVTFNWTAGGGVFRYELQLGTTGPGSSNVYNPTGTTTTALTAGPITVPAYGVTLYARLKSYINGAWVYNDYTYMESGTPVKAVLTSPAPGSTLTGTSVTFGWTAGGGVTKYEFQLGITGPGSSNVYNPSGTTTNGLTTGAITVPANGVTLYARLKSWINGTWQYNDYTYMESGTPTKAEVTSPTPGSTLTGTGATFTWTAGGGVTKYEFRLGTTGHGSGDVYNASGTTTNALTSPLITGIPAYGVTLYARLYSYINGAWQYNDYTYMESGTPVKAGLTTPTPGSILLGSSATFTWTAGSGVTKYLFRLGTTGHGSSDVYNAAGTSTTALTTGVVSGIPTTGATLYARLYSYINGAWQYNDYTYTEQ